MSSSSPREPLVPTINFSMVCPGVYRSGYPTKKNYSFLFALRLRSILYLCPEDYAESNLKFCEENGIHVLRFPTEGNKEPFNDISEPLMHRILGALCDTRNLPLLIHCNKGKHRTGTVVACLRHLQGWSLVSIFEEYKRFASDKARVGDQQYVELYHPIVKLTPPFVAPWVTVTPRVTLVTSDRELLEAETVQLGYSLLAPDNSKPGKKNKAAAATATAAGAGGAASPAGPPPPSSPSFQSTPSQPAAAAAALVPPVTVSASPPPPSSSAVAAAGKAPQPPANPSASPSAQQQPQQQQQQVLATPVLTALPTTTSTAGTVTSTNTTTNHATVTPPVQPAAGGTEGGGASSSSNNNSHSATEAPAGAGSGGPSGAAVRRTPPTVLATVPPTPAESQAGAASASHSTSAPPDSDMQL